MLIFILALAVDTSIRPHALKLAGQVEQLELFSCIITCVALLLVQPDPNGAAGIVIGINLPAVCLNAVIYRRTRPQNTQKLIRKVVVAPMLPGMCCGCYPSAPSNRP